MERALVGRADQDERGRGRVERGGEAAGGLTGAQGVGHRPEGEVGADLAATLGEQRSELGVGLEGAEDRHDPAVEPFEAAKQGGEVGRGVVLGGGVCVRGGRGVVRGGEVAFAEDGGGVREGRQVQRDDGLEQAEPVAEVVEDARLRDARPARDLLGGQGQARVPEYLLGGFEHRLPYSGRGSTASCLGHVRLRSP